MPWTILLFAAGSLAIEAPTISLVPPHPTSEEDPIHISCMAPKDFPGANFTLHFGGKVVQLVQAPVDQLRVIFNLSQAPRGTFLCRYGVMGEHSQAQLSEFSQPLQVSYPVPTWILVLALSLAGALILAVLVAVVMVIRKVKVTNLQKKRERESCWAQVNFTSDMSFDNSLFAISMKMSPEEDGTNLDAHSGTPTASVVSRPRKRPTSTSSSPELPPEFSTFRAPL
ncbi:protein HIDE1 [Rhynchocyon petersi]